MAEIEKSNQQVWSTSQQEDIEQHVKQRIPSPGNGNVNPTPTTPQRPHMVSIQSKFRRKYFHKTIFIVINIIICLLIIGLVLMAIYYRLYFKNICTTHKCVRAAANLIQSMDAQIDPCDDFYRFTCGNWAEDHPRPDNAQSNDWFAEKQNGILRTIRKMLQSNATDLEPNAVGQARRMYAACMDTAKMDTLGLQPVIKYLKEFGLPVFPRIFNVTTAGAMQQRPAEPFDWVRTVAIIRRTLGSDLLMGFDIIPNPTNRTVKMLAIGAPETGSMLPFKNDLEKRLEKHRRRRLNAVDTDDDDDDTTTDDDDSESAASNRVRRAQQKYMTEVISALLFYADSSIDLAALVPTILSVVRSTRHFDKSLQRINQAVANATIIDPENPLADLLYLNITALQSATDRLIAPRSLPIWRRYLAEIFAETTSANGHQPDANGILSSTGDMMYLEQLVELIATTSELELEFHMWWTVVADLIVHTTSDIRQLHAEHMRTVNGGLDVAGGSSRSFYCTAGVHELLGWAVSYAVLDRQFGAETQPGVADMLHNIREAFNQMVRTTTWMDAGTKCATLEKSLAMRSQIGYPEWMANGTELDGFYVGMDGMNVTRHLDNMVAVLRWQMAKELAALEEYDGDEWATTPTNVNAFHTFQANAITIPLAILQFPFYDLGIEALNYGSIGTILGHELTHGFDDNGRMYDKDGNVRQWWTDSTITEYINRTSCFIKQYSDYFVKEVDENIDGENTLGENIADNGGLREAYYAYKLYVKKHGREMMLPGLESYSSEQLFFMAYGNLWCEVQTLTSIRWAMEDSHCPGKIRLKGVLQNSPEFASTFGCAANATMNPTQRCRIW